MIRILPYEDVAHRTQVVALWRQVFGYVEGVTGFYEALGFFVEPRISMGKRIQANLPGGSPSSGLATG